MGNPPLTQNHANLSSTPYAVVDDLNENIHQPNRFNGSKNTSRSEKDHMRRLNSPIKLIDHPPESD